MTERYFPRGIGANWLECFICGDDNGGQIQPDMAAFVADREAGVRVIAMFESAWPSCHARLSPT